MPDEEMEPGEPRRDSSSFDEIWGGSDSPGERTPEPAPEPVPEPAPQPVPEPAPEPSPEPTPGSAPPIPAADELQVDTPPDDGEAPPDEGGGTDGETPRHRSKWPFLVLGLLLFVVLLTAWTKTVGSTAFCTRCHSMQASADTAAHSVHANVSCIACHRGPGVQGAVAYVPTLLRELVDQVSPLSIAKGVMDPAPCTDCHTTIFTSALLKGEHPSTGCSDCHGDSSHPKPPLVQPASGNGPHPADWVQIHGRAAVNGTAVTGVPVSGANACTTCHQPGFCATCHFKASFPHPKNWIPIHGKVQERGGADSCTLCHATTFCASCHGTEIPHASDWLQQHPTDVLQNRNAQQCLICHAVADCNFCHVRHSVHVEQGLYYGWSKQP